MLHVLQGQLSSPPSMPAGYVSSSGQLPPPPPCQQAMSVLQGQLPPCLPMQASYVSSTKAAATMSPHASRSLSQWILVYLLPMVYSDLGV